MRRVVALAVALVAAGLPSGAAAKELSGVTVCGVDGCRTSHDRAAAADISDDAMPAGPPAHAARFYTVRFHVTHDGEEMGSWTVRWAPTAGVIKTTGERGQPRFYEPSFKGLVALRGLADGLRTFPARGLLPLRGKPAAAEPAAAAPPSSPPAHDARPAAAGAGEGAPWALIAGGGALVVLLGAAAARRSRAVPRGRRAARGRSGAEPG